MVSHPHQYAYTQLQLTTYVSLVREPLWELRGLAAGGDVIHRRMGIGNLLEWGFPVRVCVCACIRTCECSHDWRIEGEGGWSGRGARMVNMRFFFAFAQREQGGWLLHCGGLSK